MLKRFLKHILLGPSGFATAGVPIVIPGRQPQLIFARVGAMLSDGDGLRQAFDWKGSASLKPCLRHWNVFKKGSDLAQRSPGHVEITCCQHEAVQAQTSEDVYEIADLLVAAKQRALSGH